MSVVKSLVESWTRSDEQKRLDAWGPYRDLLVTLANDQTPDDPQAVRNALEAVGRSADDLEADVQTMRRRLAWAEIDARGTGGAEAELATTRANLAKAQKALDEATRKYEAEYPVLQAQEKDASTRIGEVVYAREKLAETFLDPALKLRVDEFESRRQPLVRERRDLNGKIHQTKLKVEQAEKNVAPVKRGEVKNGNQTEKVVPGLWSKADQERAVATLAKVRQELEGYQSRAVEVDALLADLEGERLELETAKLQP